MLVITQKKFRRWLEGRLTKVSKPSAALPEGIALEHFNNISGLDRYKDVAGLMLIGRIQPSPQDIEAYAGALTGVEPIKMPPPAPGQPRTWFKRVDRAIRLADGGRIVKVERCDLHPDVMGEAVRLMLCEGEMLQGFGRARAINRDTPERALKVWLLNNVVLDLTVNTVMRWDEPSEVVEPRALDGLVLTSASDMVAGWPDIWKTIEAAKWTWKKLTSGAAGTPGVTSRIESILDVTPGVRLSAILYQRAGRNQKLRKGGFDPRTLPNPFEKITEKIGALVKRLHLVEKREIEPMAGNGSLDVDDTKVTVLKRVWETLEQLFDCAAKNPWRKLPKNQPKPQFVCEACDPEAPPAPHVCPAGQLGRMRYKTVAQRKAEGTYCVWPRPAESPRQRLHDTQSQ